MNDSGVLNNMKKIQVAIDDSLHKELKHLAVDLNVSTNTLIRTILSTYLASRKIPEIPFPEENTNTHLKPLPPNYAPTVTMPSVAYPEDVKVVDQTIPSPAPKHNENT